MPLLWDKTQLAAALRAIAASHAAGQPEVPDWQTRRDGVKFNEALDAVGLAFGVGDWREEE